MEKLTEKQGFGFKQFIKDSKEILLHPKEYFSGMPLSGGFSEPIIKGLIYGFIIGILHAFGSPFLGRTLWILVSLPLVFISLAFSGLFIGGVIILGISILFRGNTNYEASVRIVSSLMLIEVVRSLFLFTGVINSYLKSIVSIAITLWGLYLTYHALKLSLKIGKGTNKQSKKSLKSYKDVDKKCWLLLLSSFVNTVLLAILNIYYIPYMAFQQFKGDGFAFLGGIYILMSWIITIPAFIISFFLIRMVRNDSARKHITSIVFGILAFLAGSFLQEVTSWGVLIILFGILEIISSAICKNKNSAKSSPSSNIITKNNTLPKSITKKNYIITIFFQIAYLIWLFILSVTSWIQAVVDFELTQDEIIIDAVVFTFLFLLNVIVTIFFLKKKKLALKYRYIESYILLVFGILFFLVSIIPEAMMSSTTSFAILLGFPLLILLLIYMIYCYKRLKSSDIFI